MNRQINKNTIDNHMIPQNLFSAIEELVKKSEKNVENIKTEAKKEVEILSKKLAPEIVKVFVR